MLRNIILVLLAWTILFCGLDASTKDIPIVDVATASTGQSIYASVIETLPNGFRFENLELSRPGAVVTSVTQTNNDRFFLFTLDDDRRIKRAEAQVGATEFSLGDFQNFGLRISELYPALQVSQFTNPIRLSVFNRDQYRAYKVNNNGLSARSYTRVYPPIADNIQISGGLSPDGRFSWSSGIVNQTQSFYGIQRLSDNFKQLGNPLWIDTDAPIISGDITNQLSNGQRLFVYKEAQQVNNNNYKTRIMAQRFDPNNLTLIGRPYNLTRFRTTPFVVAENIQSVAVQPEGKYFLYTTFSLDCSKEVLRLRRFDNNFRPAGRSRTAIGCSEVQDTTEGVYGIDVLRVRLSF